MKTRIFVLCLAAVAALSGCAKVEEEPLPSEAESEPVVEEPVRTDAENEGFSFADVENLEFYFASGAGAWATTLEISADGSFKGHYEDADMGDSGEGYSSGTSYLSDFEGKFTEPEKIDDTTYSFKIESINYPLGFGEEIKDDTLYKYTEAYGLKGAEELYMYLPESKISELPEDFLAWVGIFSADSPEADSDELGFYGLYNVTEKDGFSSYDKPNA